MHSPLCQARPKVLLFFSFETEGTVVEWQKQVGDFAAMDDVVVVLETDKVSVADIALKWFI